MEGGSDRPGLAAAYGDDNGGDHGGRQERQPSALHASLQRQRDGERGHRHVRHPGDQFGPRRQRQRQRHLQLHRKPHRQIPHRSRQRQRHRCRTHRSRVQRGVPPQGTFIKLLHSYTFIKFN